MTDFVAESDVWVVIPDLSHFQKVAEGQQFTTAQTVELFDTEDEGRVRALEVGWIPDRPDDGEWEWDGQAWVEVVPEPVDGENL